MSDSTTKRELLDRLYEETLNLVEEEIYQRKNGSSYQDIPSAKAQGGGGNGDFKVGGMIPGKFDIVRHSLDVPLDVAIRGTIARQRLFAQEHGMN